MVPSGFSRCGNLNFMNQFKKVTSAGLNSLQISVKNWIFYYPVRKKGTGFDPLGARDDVTIRISHSFDEMRLSRSLRPLRLLRP